MLSDVLKRIDRMGGFLTEAELTDLVKFDRLRMVLCRFNNGRFLCPAQNVAHFVGIIEHSKEDWLRDASLPANDPIYSGDYTTSATDGVGIPLPPCPVTAHDYRAKVRANEPAYVDPDGNEHGSAAAVGHFNESDCGGAFDGFTVTSDADPGL